MQAPGNLKNPAAWVEGIIRDFVRNSPANTLKNPANDKAWADPLVGFSRGDDPLYESYKNTWGRFTGRPWKRSPWPSRSSQAVPIN